MWEKAREIWLRFSRARVGTHASSIAFYFFLSAVPLIIVYAWLVPGRTIGEEDVVAFLTGLVPESLDMFVTTLVAQAYNRSGIAFSLSALVLLWTAAQGAKALRRGLNAVYEVKENRNAAMAVGVSFLFIVAIVAVLSVVLYLIFSGGVLSAIAGLVPVEEVQIPLAGMLESLAMLVVGILLFAACYTYLAAGSRSYRAQIPGAVLSSVVWYAFSLIFRMYLASFNRFTLFYGSLAAPALFLFWLFCIFYILLVGGFANHCFAEEIEGKLGIRA